MTSETSRSTPTFLASILLFHRPIYHSDPWGNKKHSKEKKCIIKPDMKCYWVGRVRGVVKSKTTCAGGIDLVSVLHEYSVCKVLVRSIK